MWFFIFEGVLALMIIIPSFWGYRSWMTACLVVVGLLLLVQGPTAIKVFQLWLIAIYAFLGFGIAFFRSGA